MKVRIFQDAASVAREAAAIIAMEARKAIAARDVFLMAVSGGRTPCSMLRALAADELPWPQVHVVQVDERVAPAADPDRNLAHLRASLEGPVSGQKRQLRVRDTSRRVSG